MLNVASDKERSKNSALMKYFKKGKNWINQKEDSSVV